MTSSMPWVKLYTEMLDDPKIGRLCDAVKWRFVSLVLLAGECDQDGALINGSDPMSVTDIAWRLRITRDQCETEMQELTKCGVLDDDAGVYFLPKFSERQGRPQSEKREAWRLRKAKQRESQKSQEDVTEESRVIHASRVEESREEKIQNKSKKKSKSAEKTPRPAPAQIPPGVSAYREAAHRYPNKSLYGLIDERVGHDPNSVNFWREVVIKYIALGWNPANITGQLEWFDRRELPSKNGSKSGNGSITMLDVIREAQKDPNYGK